MPTEGLPKTNEDKIKRRTVLKAGAFSLGSLFVSKISSKGVKDKVKVPSEEEEILEEISKLPYPDKKQVPEFLHEYVEKFPNWREVVEAQKTQMLEFLRSGRYEEIVTLQFKQHFPEKDAKDIQVLVSTLIKDRIENFLKTKVKYQKLKDDLGKYFPDIKVAIIDTTLTIPKVEDEPNREIKTLDMFVTIHEYLHSTQKPGLMSGECLIYMLKLLAESNSPFKEKFKEIVEHKNFEDRLGINKEGRTDFSSKFGRPREKPEEIPSFIMQIRASLHNVYKTATVANMPKFDMNTDVFTEKHYDFLEKNQFKIFSTVRVGEPEDTTIFQEMTKLFGKNNFIEMMNKIA